MRHEQIPDPDSPMSIFLYKISFLFFILTMTARLRQNGSNAEEQLHQPLIEKQCVDDPEVGQFVSRSQGRPLFRARKGHTCCGCCCDTRRAVIIVNILQICFTAFYAIPLILGFELLSFAQSASLEIAKEMDHPASEKISEAVQLLQIPMALFCVLIFAQLVTYVLGVVGAATFSKWMISVSIMGYCVSILTNLLQGNLPGFLFSGSLHIRILFSILR